MRWVVRELITLRIWPLWLTGLQFFQALLKSPLTMAGTLISLILGIITDLSHTVLLDDWRLNGGWALRPFLGNAMRVRRVWWCVDGLVAAW